MWSAGAQGTEPWVRVCLGIPMCAHSEWVLVTTRCPDLLPRGSSCLAIPGRAPSLKVCCSVQEQSKPRSTQPPGVSSLHTAPTINVSPRLWLPQGLCWRSALCLEGSLHPHLDLTDPASVSGPRSAPRVWGCREKEADDAGDRRWYVGGEQWPAGRKGANV